MSAQIQNLIALSVAGLAGLWALKLLLMPFLASLRPEKSDRCMGGCGCGHEDKNTQPQSGKVDACATPGPDHNSHSMH